MTGAVETWLVLAAGIGSGLLGGFYLAFSLVVMPALRDRPAGEATSAMVAINEAAVRAPFMVLSFGTALACLIVVTAGWSAPGAPARVLGALASLTGWVLTLAISVPFNTRLAGTERSTVVWHAYARPWTRANHLRAGLSLLGALGLLSPLP
jgi:uncharacterized membrane protein